MPSNKNEQINNDNEQTEIKIKFTDLFFELFDEQKPKMENFTCFHQSQNKRLIFESQ